MDEEYEDEANADLTLGIISKAHGRAQSHLSLSPKTQAFFAAEEDKPLEIIELNSDEEEQDQQEEREPSVEIISEMPAASKRRKVNSGGYASDPPDRKTRKSKKKNKSKVKLKQLRKAREEEEAAEEEEALVREETPPVRKRAPRYFDPPEAALTCYNCGEPGHFAADCSAKRDWRPCYGCGSRSHRGNDCPLAQACQEKQTPVNCLCMQCGDSGHSRTGCRRNYPPDDLKAVQCYVCKQLGHLCCVDGIDSFPRHPSCYNCGSSGHTGTACNRPAEAPAPKPKPPEAVREDGGSRRKKTPASNGKKMECYKCGGQGHKARECREHVEIQCYKCGLDGHLARECKQVCSNKD